LESIFLVSRKTEVFGFNKGEGETPTRCYPRGNTWSLFMLWRAFRNPQKALQQMGKLAWIRSTKARRKPLFDEPEKDALCLFQLRNALLI